MMIDHAWLAVNEDGELYVSRVERKAPLADDEVKKFPDGSRTVRPVETLEVILESWQIAGSMRYIVEDTRVLRTWEILDRSVEECRSIRLDQIRTDAQIRILSIASAHKQANLTARAAEIALYEPKPWSPELEAELDAGRAIWHAINSIRDASNEAEVAVISASTPQEVFEVTANWPE